jgi:ribosome maturation factor RimP
MGRDVSRILAIAEPIAAERGLEVLDIEMAGTASNPLVRVLLDSPDEVRRVGIDDCQAVSQRLGDALDAYEAVSGQYMLEVSSPGLNRPLKRIEHFRRVLGRKVRVRTKAPGGDRRSFIGRLEEADESAVTVAVEGGDAVRIAFAEIEKANLEFEFEQTPGRGTKAKKGAKSGPSADKKARR